MPLPSESPELRRFRPAWSPRCWAALSVVVNLSLFGLAFAGDARESQNVASEPIRIHSHNDYEHARPLLDALAHRAGSVEADVHLVDGHLLVAHDLADVRPGRTLEVLYLDPLRAHVGAHGGRVFPGEQNPLILLVDVKSEAVETYRVLAGVLERYADLLTEFRGNHTEVRAVTVIVSGNRDRAALAGEARRHAAMDGRIEDLGGAAAVALIPLVSDNWAKLFAWRGEGPMPEPDRRRLHALADQARQEGRILRFWNTPDRPEFWQELRAAGVGLIGTDNLEALRRFIDVPSTSKPPERKTSLGLP